MSTLRELASESIGKITRRTLEPQIDQVDRALERGETPLALAPGSDAGSGVLVVVTGRRVLVSTGAPFAKPKLVALTHADLLRVVAEADGQEWRLDLDHLDGRTSVRGMFDRDAHRIAALLAAGLPAS